MIPKNKVQLELKKTARKLFEAGMDMPDIAIQLKINLQTLYNLSSKENWEKGKRKELIHCLETEEELLQLKEVIAKVISDYIQIEQNNREIIQELQKDEKETPTGEIKRALVKSRAEAAVAHMIAASTGFKLAKDLYNIRTPNEEVELAINKLKYESLKKKLFDDVTEGDIEL
ncbi:MULTISPECIES: hypothetical protein [Bacteria]|uniref:hypothetical protein n=1 Tax=Bacteria TaxID=2 RepID=UPI002FC7DF89